MTEITDINGSLGDTSIARGTGVTDADARRHGPGAVDYAQLLGEAAFNRIVPAVRDRMAQHVAQYVGVMDCVELSVIGRALAWLAVPLGQPLATRTGADVPVCVDVFPASDGGDTWRRCYNFGQSRSVEVSSIKRQTDTGVLVECLGQWLQMELELSEQAGSLVFESKAYTLRLGRFALTLPPLLNPGCTRVVHRDLGNERFRFELTITHPLLGRLATQGGTFRERSASK